MPEQISSLWSPFKPEHIDNPYAMYKKLREENPVFLSQTGEWIISRYADIKFVLKSQDFRTGNRLEWLARGVQYLAGGEQNFQPIQDAINSFLLFLNPPDHQLIRNFVVKTWNDRAVESIIRKRVGDQLESIRTPTFDLVESFSQPLPVLIISDIMGIPAGDYRFLLDLGTKMHRSLDLYHSYKDLVELNDASRSFIEYFRTLVGKKTSHPENDLISKLIHSPLRGSLDDRHLISICIFLFTASEETTASSIGTGLLNLMRHPENYRHLTQHPDQVPIAVDELLRYDAPVQLLGRIAKSRINIGGVSIPEGAQLTLLIGGANRDPAEFDDAEELILTRSPNHHLAFSSGSHFCLGDWLGKLQTQIAIEGFLERFPSATMADHKITWKKNLAIRGLRSLAVRVPG